MEKKRRNVVKDNIKQFRTDRGMSQIDLAEEIGVSKKTISNWECGARDPSTSQLHDIAKALHVAPADLIGHINEPQDNTFGYIMPDNSMSPEIMPGDTLTIKRTTNTQDGDIVLVESKHHPDKSIIRRLYSFGRTFSLLAVNSSIAPISGIIDDLVIKGKVTELKRKI